MLQRTDFINTIRALQRTQSNLVHSSKRWTNALQLMNFPKESHPRCIGMMTPLLLLLC